MKGKDQCYVKYMRYHNIFHGRVCVKYTRVTSHIYFTPLDMFSICRTVTLFRSSIAPPFHALSCIRHQSSAGGVGSSTLFSLPIIKIRETESQK